MPLVCHVGARRVRVIADVRVEWPERRGSAACHEMWERRGRSFVVSAVAATGVVAWDRYWGGVVCCRWRAMWGLGGGA